MNYSPPQKRILHIMKALDEPVMIKNIIKYERDCYEPELWVLKKSTIWHNMDSLNDLGLIEKESFQWWKLSEYGIEKGEKGH